MAALAILNPRKRKSAGGKKRRRKMSAKQLKFFGPRKSRKAPKAKRSRKSKSKVIIVQSNPKRSSMAAKKKTRHRRRKAKVFTHKSGVKRYRRNPRSIEAGFFNNTLIPAAIGAAGAIGSDWLLSYAPIPPQYKTGGVGVVLKIASALLVGAAVGAVAGRESGEEAAAGGVIVTLYGMSRGFLAGAGMPAGAMSRYVPMNRYVPMQGWGSAPVNRGGGRPGLGYINPARIGPPVPSRANLRFMSNGR